MKIGAKFIKDKDFISFALEGGVSSKVDFKECHEIVVKNYGSLIGIFALIYYPNSYIVPQLNNYNTKYEL